MSLPAGRGPGGLSAIRPRLLDLYCGAGGSAEGLQYAGFHVTGVDIRPQPRYCGDGFIQANALLVEPAEIRQTYQAVWASPPCQSYSRMTVCRHGLSAQYPDLIGATRRLLDKIGLPYVIENVEGAPLLNPMRLCGAMFRLATYRHRLFETKGFDVWSPPHRAHAIPASKAGHWEPGTMVSVAGHCAPIEKCRLAMEIDWMNREELGEAIPPSYSKFIGVQMLEAIQ